MSSEEELKPPQKKLGLWKRLKCALCCSSPEPKTEDDGPHLVDDNLNNVLDHWSKQHHIKKVEQHKASELLKAQLEQYQREIEDRKHRNDDEETGTVLTMMKKTRKKKKFKHHKLSDTEDKLPYELKPISTNWKSAMEKLGSMHPTQSMGAAVEAAVETKKVSQREGQQKSSSTSSSSGIEEWEKAGHLTDLLMDIMREEAQWSDLAVEKESPELSSKQLAALSRADMKQFEHIIVENTKECLFLSLPTVQEMENYENEEARPGRKFRKKVNVNTKAVEIRTFCPKCPPRHWKNRCTQ